MVLRTLGDPCPPPFICGDLAQLLDSRRARLLESWSPRGGGAAQELAEQVARFLDEIIATLQGDMPETSVRSVGVRRRHRFSAFDAVCEYGTLLDSILDLAMEAGVEITLDEHRVLLAAASSGAAAIIADCDR